MKWTKAGLIWFRTGNFSYQLSVVVSFQLLGVEKVVADLPSHSEPCMRLSPTTAPSLTVPLLGIQLVLAPWYILFWSLKTYP
ncbi:MAG: hypothetical protein EWV89_13830 [Microcystis wesenbergii Mw_QC_B_20070930_S4]|jgi:predicted membrane metal-binding protein|nr:MAG: hypothetical protein EWV73_19730 [Microcystis wesenbergii Mw_QC_B_20070930_S4D]TRV12087.1 MAG: hypothetical protein EWV89_13830 [Microcystis wesenbergii Mw_QC_B_20070930_S4]